MHDVPLSPTHPTADQKDRERVGTVGGVCWGTEVRRSHLWGGWESGEVAQCLGVNQVRGGMGCMHT